jgi:hypothetical protein
VLLSVDDASDAVLQHRHIEIDHEAQALSSQPEIRQQLRLVNPRELLDGLDFHEHLIFNDHIQLEATAQCHSFVVNRHGELRLERQIVLVEFVQEALLIRGLEESRAEVPVNLDGAADDLGSCRWLRLRPP